MLDQGGISPVRDKDSRSAGTAEPLEGSGHRHRYSLPDTASLAESLPYPRLQGGRFPSLRKDCCRNTVVAHVSRAWRRPAESNCRAGDELGYDAGALDSNHPLGDVPLARKSKLN